MVLQYGWLLGNISYRLSLFMSFNPEIPLMTQIILTHACTKRHEQEES